jgi:hypothetical protein
MMGSIQAEIRILFSGHGQGPPAMIKIIDADPAVDTVRVHGEADEHARMFISLKPLEKKSPQTRSSRGCGRNSLGFRARRFTCRLRRTSVSAGG